MSEPPQSVDAKLRDAGLPQEEGSPSEILAASHIFTVTILQLSETEWSPAAEGLEEREVLMTLRLDSNLKGVLRVSEGDTFTLKVRQRREPGMVVSDYHGFWSHQAPAAGMRFLVLAAGYGDDPAALMDEPALLRLTEVAHQSDVTLAAALEARFGRALRDPLETGRAALALQLLAEAGEQRTRASDLLAHYVWARIESVYESSDEAGRAALEEAVLDIISAEDGTPDFRTVLVNAVIDAVLDHEPGEAHRARLARRLLPLLAQPTAHLLADSLLQTRLYNLIFDAEGPPLNVQLVVPDPAERGRLAAVARQFDSDRAEEVAAWLEGR